MVAITNNENIEKLFNDDARLKKKIGSNVFKRTGKRGYVGSVRMPSDLMSRKEKYNYRKGGKVEYSKMAVEIMPWEEFRAMPYSEQRKTLMLFRKKFTNELIRETWGLSSYEYYTKLVKKELSLPSTRKSRNKVGSENASPVKRAPKLNEGLTYSINGIYESSEIKSKLEKLVALMDIEDDTEFTMNLTLIERPKPEEDLLESGIEGEDEVNTDR